jgi:hypothetical protein
MRLLSTNANGSFSLTSFTDHIPSYAILSHRWEADDQELTFQDMMNGSGTDKAGYKKIRFCGEQAKNDGLKYFWVDSCCIDKTNFTELSTAINSMFRWYRKAAKCYVYLSDVFAGEGSQRSKPQWVSAFSQSQWFTRGWTLQELIAPMSVEFFSLEGIRLGDKKSLELRLEQVTGIPVQTLRGDTLSQISIKERISWMANRETTIEEDIVYSLFGIFDIHMPLIYGEGAVNALYRLGEAIEKYHSVRQYRKPCC